MPVTTYNKLVRDLIPDIIAADGKSCVCSTLSNEGYIAMLDEKLNEELAEYQQSKSMEELADLLEVIRAVAKARGSSIQEVEAIRKAKAEKRGGFEKKILLEEVREGEMWLFEKQADWSLFVDGFAIPLRSQEYFRKNPDIAIRTGERKAITLVIENERCEAELYDFPIDRNKNPDHAPIMQVRYKSDSAAACAFRRVFWKSWVDMSAAKATAAPRKRVKADVKESFRILLTDDPLVFDIECSKAGE